MDYGPQFETFSLAQPSGTFDTPGSGGLGFSDIFNIVNSVVGAGLQGAQIGLGFYQASNQPNQTNVGQPIVLGTQQSGMQGAGGLSLTTIVIAFFFLILLIIGIVAAIKLSK